MTDQPKWLPNDKEIAAKLPDRPLYESYGEEFDPADLHEPIRALILEAVRAHDSERFGQYLLDMRGIDGEPCRECGGVGVKAYSNTSTWRGGVGGQMITNAVCDRCWGSGDPDRPWVNLRTLKSDQEQAIRAAVEKALAEQEARHRREVLEAKIEAVRAAAKYSRDAASLEPDDDVGEAHTRTAERLDRMAASYAELAAIDKGVDK